MQPTRNSRIEAIFDELADLPLPEQNARLGELCAGDGALHEELRKLLAADRLMESSHDGGIVGGFVSEPVPLRVGSYVIRGVAGEGGMGAVYEAIHEPTQRRAAVKLLRIGTSNAHGRTRMRIEAETLGRLDSPNIAQLYDAGVAEVVYGDGRGTHQPFIAMEFVSGQPIVAYACDAQLTVRQRISLMQKVAQAVHHAHQRGVIHRDLKPGNILVLPDGTPKVVDFGVARLIDAAGENVTLTGQLIGTLRYMSPEQASGDHRNVDIRADVYALGAILYELLAGRPLVALDTGASLSAAMQVLRAVPQRLGQVRAELGGDIDAIVHKATAFEPDERYSSAQALADDLRLFLEGREVSARSPTTLERIARFVRRNKGKVAIAATIVLLLVGGMIGTSWGLLRADEARRAEADQRQRAEQSAEAARNADADSRAFSTFLVERVLAAARPTDVQGGLGLDATVIDAIRHAEAHLEEDLAGRPVAEAVARQAIGATWRNRGDLAQAERHLRRAAELADAARGPGDPLTLNIRNSLLVTLQQLGRNEDGIKLQEQIVRGFEAAAGPRDRRTLSARYNLAIYLAKAGDYSKALPLLEQVHADRLATLGAENVETLTTVADIAEVNLLLGNPEKGVQMQEQLLATVRRVFGEDNPQTYNAQYRLACLLQRADRPAEAAMLHESVIPKLSAALGDQNVTALDARLQLAKCYLSLNQPDRAVVRLREYASGQRKLLGERSEQSAKLLGRIAALLFNSKQFAAAEEFARSALAIFSDFNAQTTFSLEVQCLLGESLHAQGRDAEAEPVLTAALDGLDRQTNLSPPMQQRQASATAALIRIYESTGRHDEAARRFPTTSTSGLSD